MIALIALGARVNEPDGSNQSALHYAAGYGHLSVAKDLVALEAHVNLLYGNGLYSW